ncbi:hypothetical protein LAZ67_17000068 [Cordylochernes scorpioides]|uniref:Ribosomal protein S3 n=1 Tax=Cordylochernes scorpioides TaxID=51811 RepID=A0ABY6LCF5_9ARAC|nr:hypothetical protein LAZ67_17000068 [Cordylochernes scorpioides]
MDIHVKPTFFHTLKNLNRVPPAMVPPRISTNEKWLKNRRRPYFPTKYLSLDENEQAAKTSIAIIVTLEFINISKHYSRIFGDEQDLCAMGAEWRVKGESASKKAKSVPSFTRIAIAFIFWDAKRILFINYLNKWRKKSSRSSRIILQRTGPKLQGPDFTNYIKESLNLHFVIRTRSREATMCSLISTNDWGRGKRSFGNSKVIKAEEMSIFIPQ